MAENSDAGQSPWVLDVEEATFVRDVIERSDELPVVVDFWAPWCAPCRMLGPVLERLATEFDGKFLLAKANTEVVPSLAMEFGAQSIPYVVAIRRRQIVDQFVGALPEPQLRAWLERVLPTPVESLIADADRLAATEPAAAEAKYREAMELAPNQSAAAIGLANALLQQGRLSDCRAEIEKLRERGYLEPVAERVAAELHLAEQRQNSRGVAACRAALAEAPDDLSRQWELANALAAERQIEEAFELYLGLVRKDRKGLGEQARAAMVELFQVLQDEELVSTWRRRLSSAMY